MNIAPEIDAPSISKLTIEITTRCNLNCVMCPHGLPGGYPGGMQDASDALVNEVIKFKDNVRQIQPTGVGEPMLSAGFWRIVDNVRGTSSPKLTFITNGILLTEKNISRLELVPLHIVNVSLDACDPDTYAKIRGSSIEKIISGIKRLVEMRNMRPSAEQFHIQLSIVLMLQNIHEFPDFIRMSHELGVDIVYAEHLTDPQCDPNAWNVRRGNWNFNYEKNWLRNHKDLSDRYVEEAMDIADKLGIYINGYNMIYDEILATKAEDRWCREWQAKYEAGDDH